MSNPNPGPRPKKFYVHEDGRSYGAPRRGDDDVGPARPGFRLATGSEAARIVAGKPHAEPPPPAPVSAPAVKSVPAPVKPQTPPKPPPAVPSASSGK